MLAVVLHVLTSITLTWEQTCRGKQVRYQPFCFLFCGYSTSENVCLINIAHCENSEIFNRQICAKKAWALFGGH